MREVGEVFDVPESVFKARKERDAAGNEIEDKFTAPGWFKPHTPTTAPTAAEGGESKGGKKNGRQGGEDIA